MRMILTQDVSHYPCGFLIGLIISHPLLVHCIQDAAVDRFETIPYIRQSASHDDAHGVINIRALHLVLDVDG